MNAVIPGAIWKTFGVLFLEVQAKYNASAAFLSWTSSMAMALALFMGKYAFASRNIVNSHLCFCRSKVFVFFLQNLTMLTFK